MKRYKFLIPYIICTLALFGCDNNDHYYNPEPPIGGNGRDVLATAATGSVVKFENYIVITGRVTSEGSSTVTEWGICIEDKPFPTTKVIDDSGNKSSFSILLSNLEKDKEYYYRAFAISSVGIAYGREYSFTINSLPVSEEKIPTVVTVSATGNNMAINATGNITYDGGFTITERGFCFGTDAEPTLENSTKVTLTIFDNFKATIGGLTTNTDYFVRAYATNSMGTGYGNIIKVSTSECTAFTMPFEMDFANEPTFPPPCWSTIDHDGDGYSWLRQNYSVYKSAIAALSLSQNEGAGLNPYNILITPKIHINGTNPAIRWTVLAADRIKFAEHYKLVISEVPITSANCENPSIVKTLFEETLTEYDRYYEAYNLRNHREYVYLADYRGKDVYFAWVHYNSNNLSGIYIADISVFDSSYTIPTFPFYETFSSGAERFPPKGWSGFNFNTSSSGWWFNWGSDGRTAAGSTSYKESVWNIIKTPQLLIGEINPTLSWTVESSNILRPHENYKVVISEVPITENNARDRNVVKTLFEETLDQSAVYTPQNRSVNLSSYAGKPVYIGWVHYDCMQGTLYLYNIKVE